MYFQSKKITLLILGVIALICSRVMFVFFNDPEGPNLLVVTGMALALFFPSLLVYKFNSSMGASKRLLIAILIQALLATGLYFFLS